MNTSPDRAAFRLTDVLFKSLTLPRDRVAARPKAAKMLFALLAQLREGSLIVTCPDGSVEHFGMPPQHSQDTQTSATIHLHDWQVCSRVLRGGDIGFAETYIDGLWSTHQLRELLSLLIANRKAIESAVYGAWWGTALQRLRHLLNRNTTGQARKNIQAHYDLGNDFYRLWLDESMTYSSALHLDKHTPLTEQTLWQAQQAKYQRVLQEIGLRSGMRLLEIGCGWGGLAEAAAARNAQVTGLTLSSEQLAYARARLQAQHPGAAEFRLQDYRDENAQYDGIASIEMFEAVGEAYWPGYFDCIKRNLKPGAKACVQSIVIADELFPRYRKGTDFIQQYIFPGGMLPSPSVFRAQAARAGLKVINEIAFGEDYAQTLRLWHQAFMSQLSKVRELGYDERFIRTWSFYLLYCEAAFAQGNTDVMQFTLQAE